MNTMQKITPFLWFNNQADEAANFYTSIIKDSKITDTMYYNEAGPMPNGTVLSKTFELYGQEYIAFNGGSAFPISPAVSFFIHCETQEEVDYLWEKLGEGGQIQQCGWLTDKFGITWQIVPNILGELLQSKDREKAKRVMQAMMKMIKLDIQGLKQAYEGQ